MPVLITILLLSYLIGSIPTSVIVARLVKGIDIRQYGSGNAGATNVLRVLGWKAALPVALFDVFKGTLAVLVFARLRFGDTPLPIDDLTLQAWAGAAAVVGHIWPVFARFRGGKGVATTLGVLLGLYPLAAVLFVSIFLLVALPSGYVSLGSITAALLIPVILHLAHIYGWLTVPDPVLRITVLFAGLILFAHRENVKRLATGTENRFGKRRRAKPSE